MKYGDEGVSAILDILNEQNIPYTLVGSLSSNTYGESRSTKDADFVIQLDPDKRKALFSAFPPEFDIEDQVRFETITGHTRQFISIPSIPFEIELFDLSDEPFDQSRFERKIKTIMSGRTVWLPTPEDVVVQKLRWAKLGSRPKDLLDAQGIVRLRSETLDWDYIKNWCKQLSIEDKVDDLN